MTMETKIKTPIKAILALGITMHTTIATETPVNLFGVENIQYSTEESRSRFQTPKEIYSVEYNTPSGKGSLEVRTQTEFFDWESVQFNSDDLPRVKSSINHTEVIFYTNRLQSLFNVISDPKQICPFDRREVFPDEMGRQRITFYDQSGACRAAMFDFLKIANPSDSTKD